MDCTKPGFSVHGAPQARILEWVSMPSSRRSSQPRDQTQVLTHYRWILYCLSHQGSPWLERSSSNNLRTINARENLEKGELSYTLIRMQIGKPIWRTVWRVLKKLKTELPYDPAPPLLGTYPDKTVVQKAAWPCTQRAQQHYLQEPRQGSNSHVATDRRIDRKDLVYLYMNTQRSITQPKKEWNSAICRDVEQPSNGCTERSKSEREKQVSYIITYTWDLEKWYKWTCLQSRNRVQM